MSILYIVATPIGNLSDISLRALDVLKSVELLAAEDTRCTQKLLTHFGIHVKLLSCRSQNEERAAEKIISALDRGENVAYTSDAGSPALSDPGALLVRKVVQAGHTVLPVPGPSAFAALLSIAGIFDKSVVFEGFLSPKAGRRKSRLQELLSGESAFVLYESPYRIVKLFSDLVELDSKRSVCVGREMTKLHEEYLRGSAAEIYELLVARKEQRGEFAVCVSGKRG